MKQLFSIAAFSISVFLISCSGDKKNTTEETTTPTEVTQDAAITPAQPAGEQTIISESQPMGTAPAQVAPASGTTGARLNPAHGEPGHDCAVPVGSPLPEPGAAPAATSAPQQITATPSTSAPTSIMNTPPASAPTTAGATAPGMNPPHGQPGHDCAIPVGSPLKK